MQIKTPVPLMGLLLSATVLALSGCGGGGGGSTLPQAEIGARPNTPIADTPIPDTPTPDTPVVVELPPLTQKDAASFLMASSFGPIQTSIDELVDTGYDAWVRAQFDLPITPTLTAVEAELDLIPVSSRANAVSLEAWLDGAILGQDQLRQRAAFALSQIFVTSTSSSRTVRKGLLHARYMDIMQENAFGNYRDLMEEVTYNPLMGVYLTYLGSVKADPDLGTSPDENYARELMQLFTIGLVELNSDATPKLDGAGQEIETYTNEDIVGLAKVFTGLWWGGLPYGGNPSVSSNPSIDTLPMEMNEDEHSQEEKSFLGETILEGFSGNEDISEALDVLFNHPNLAPFVSKQLIQRITTSNPSPAYVQRVVTAFETGRYTFRDGQMIGSGLRGDMKPVWAAIMLDDDVMYPEVEADPTFGKVREPVIRFVHWARYANVDAIEVPNEVELRLNGFNNELGQTPYRSPSVFNFYRPDYTATGSNTGDAGLLAPELQITTAPQVINYANAMMKYVGREPGGSSSWGPFGFAGGYENEIGLAEDPAALADHLNLILTAGRMDDVTLENLRAVISSVDFDDTNRAEKLKDRVQLATQLAVTSEAFLVQQ